MNENKTLSDSGRFILGCNYWASHAGTAMWSDWRADVVEKDLKTLSEAGLEVLRVFPLWSDFQPIQLLRGWSGISQEYRFGEDPLPDDDAGRAGVSAEMMHRFAQLISLAEKYHLKLIVSLLAGWMSGRLFVPPALEGRNLLTDPLAMMWQVRFAKYFVKQFKNASAIIAWEPGNECNCLATANREQAWLWCSTITDAVRAIDADRPILSGMHGLKMKFDSSWTIQDQAELTDMLTTHPYPLFTPHCDLDPINTMRSGLHATAESRMYADISGKPCMAEEVGTLGSMMACDTVVADYVRMILFSLWAHDCQGLLWWCAFDQSHLEQAPYDWCAVERELGLLRLNGQPKPVLAQMTKFRAFLDSLPFATLPARLTDAVCILTEGQDHWAAAFGSFILAKQAGFDLVFRYEDQPLPESPLYLLPSISGLNVIHRRRWLELLERVQDGATLYISHQDGILSPFDSVVGAKVLTRQRRTGPATIRWESSEDDSTFTLGGPVKLNLEVTEANVLAREADGNPVLTVCAYGKGKIYFLSLPMETELVKTPGGFSQENTGLPREIYRNFSLGSNATKAVEKETSYLGVTEHPMGNDRRVVVLINYSPDRMKARFALSSAWQIESAQYGDTPVGENRQLTCEIPANDAAVFTIRCVAGELSNTVR